MSAFDIATPLSDLLETTLKEGPQVISKDGVEAAVLISIEDWKHLKASEPPPQPARRSLKEILLDPNGPHDIYIPPRGRYRSRPPVEFE